jgi:tRNA modification GTPase
MNGMTTIFAQASAPGRGGVAVVRVSGEKAFVCANILTGNDKFIPRQAELRSLRNAGGTLIDHALVIRFPAPASYTGEDVVEFHVHGGRAVVEALFEALCAVDGVRPAGPGEFTRRAVENGKLDLTQAEAIADLVDAETESQREQALKQYGGALGELYEGWRAELVKVLAYGEAAIDFADEDLPETLDEARAGAAKICHAIDAHLADGRRGEIVRDGFRVAVVGPANAGKSSLVNALARREVAIVSPEAGTTRDVIEVHLDLGGTAVILSDTAGLREAKGDVEAEGMRRALLRAEEADLVLLLMDGSKDAKDFSFPEKIKKKQCITVWNKADLSWKEPRRGLAISVKSGEGLDALVAKIAAAATERLNRGGRSAPLTRARHRHALEACSAALHRAGKTEATELFAEDIRLAMRELGRITGRVDVEDVLDVVFKDFCIGK